MSSAPRGLARGQPTRCPCAAYASGHPVAEHLDTGQTTPQASRLLACHRGCGTKLEWRVLHPNGLARGTRADTVPACSLGLGRPVAEHLDTGQTTPQASSLERLEVGWLAQGAVALSSSCGFCTPRGLARDTCADTVPVCRLGLGRPVTEHLDTGQTTPQASRWVGLHRGLWR